jgi:hypothetical protein
MNHACRPNNTIWVHEVGTNDADGYKNETYAGRWRSLQITEEFNEFVSKNTAARAVGGKSDKSDMKSLTDTVRAMPQ